MLLELFIACNIRYVFLSFDSIKTIIIIIIIESIKLIMNSKEHHVNKLVMKFMKIRDSLLVIGHFRVPPGLCIKTRLGAQPLMWK